ncbi:hypothetical protein L7F22_033416 [Adiantum nelumboides]|nr:hypothetical protein [Adiantum nelumboides]
MAWRRGSWCTTKCRLWKDPTSACLTVHSTFMMETKFTGSNNTSKKFGSTGFWVAPYVGLTASHSVDEYDEKGHRGSLSSIHGCKGKFIPPTASDSDAFECMQFNNMRSSTIPTSPPLQAMYDYRGFDLCMFLTKGPHGGQGFLLPCSPNYEKCKEISAYSYPHVTHFMIDAKAQLKDGVKPKPLNDVWTAYKATMELRAKKLNVTATKDELYDLLEETFYGFYTRQKVASLSVVNRYTEETVTGSYSTLGGSSGALVSPLHHGGYFIGVHVSSCMDLDANIAISCDNPEFVQQYKIHVLPKLPHKYDLVWRAYDIRPFLSWCEKHHIVWDTPCPKQKREDGDGASSN